MPANIPDWVGVAEAQNKNDNLLLAKVTPNSSFTQNQAALRLAYQLAKRTILSPTAVNTLIQTTSEKLTDRNRPIDKSDIEEAINCSKIYFTQNWQILKKTEPDLFDSYAFHSSQQSVDTRFRQSFERESIFIRYEVSTTNVYIKAA